MAIPGDRFFFPYPAKLSDTAAACHHPAPGEEIEKVKRVIAGVLGSDARILQDPSPTVAVLGIEGGGVNFAVRPWVRTDDYWDVYFDTNENMKKRFDEEGIRIPVPRRDVHMLQA